MTAKELRKGLFVNIRVQFQDAVFEIGAVQGEGSDLRDWRSGIQDQSRYCRARARA